MKLWHVILAGIGNAAAVVAGEVNVGDSLAQVRAALGEPKAYIISGADSVFFYDRGKVELVSNMVVKAAIISRQEFERRELVRLQREAAMRQLAEQQRAQHLGEGKALREARLADSVFMSSPAASRVAYWQWFRQRYPEIPLGDEYTLPLRELEQQYLSQNIERQRQRQIDDLENRVADAEQRAQRAEARRSPSYEFGSEYPYVVLPYYSYGYAPAWATLHALPVLTAPSWRAATISPPLTPRYPVTSPAWPGMSASSSAAGWSIPLKSGF